MILRAVALPTRVEYTDELHEWDAEDGADLLELDEIKTTLTALVLADERLGRMEAFGNVHLAEARLNPVRPEQRTQSLVGRRVDRLVHVRSRRYGCAISEYGIRSTHFRRTNAPTTLGEACVAYSPSR